LGWQRRRWCYANGGEIGGRVGDLERGSNLRMDGILRINGNLRMDGILGKDGILSSFGILRFEM
jgi:hypothetical protein